MAKAKKKIKATPADKIEHSTVTIWREDDYEITITRTPGDNGWCIKQGITDADPEIFLPDDEAADTLALAITRLKEMAEVK